MDEIVDRNDISTVSIQRQEIDISRLISQGGRSPDLADEFEYMRVPNRAPAEAPTWQIVVSAVGEEQRLLPLELAGDAVLGTSLGKVETNADVDLTLWGAHELGVSRHHLRLRPTAHKLFAMDLGSKNGSHINGLRLSPSNTVALSHTDYLSLGNLHLRVFILSRP